MNQNVHQFEVASDMSAHETHERETEKARNRGDAERVGV